MIITISGAHGSGKTTLTSAVEQELAKHDIKTFIVPSMSRNVLKMLEGYGILSYTEADEQVDRHFLQNLMISEACSLISKVFAAYRNDPTQWKQDRTVVMFDRWLCDIHGHSVQEIESAFTLEAVCASLAGLSKIVDKSLSDNAIPIVHSYIDYQEFKLQEKSSRGTSDPIDLQRLMLLWFEENKKQPLMITERDLDKRVQQLLPNILEHFNA